MKNNKHWQKENTVVTTISDDADLENTTTESLQEVFKPEVQLESEVITEVTKPVTFTPSEVAALLKVGKQDALKEMLEMVHQHSYNMLDSITQTEAHKVGAWLECKLKKDGKL